MTTNVNDFSVEFSANAERKNLELYSIYDAKLNRFMPPFFCSCKDDAIRQAKQIVNYTPSLINKFPEDYSLYSVGQFDEIHGVLVTTVTELIVNFKDIVSSDTIQFDEIKKDIQHQNYVVTNLTKDLEAKFDDYDKKMKELSILYDKYSNAVKNVELFPTPEKSKKLVLKKLFSSK